jgi:hypothetical protein
LFSFKTDLNLLAFLYQEKPFTGFLYPFNAFFKNCPACREWQTVLLCDRKYDTKKKARTIVVIPHSWHRKEPCKRIKQCPRPYKIRALPCFDLLLNFAVLL